VPKLLGDLWRTIEGRTGVHFRPSRTYTMLESALIRGNPSEDVSIEDEME